MPLSWLAWVSNFCSNSLSPFISIIRILSSQAISFQILLYTLFPWFPWLTLLPFPSLFNFHNLTYLGTDVSTHEITIPPQMALNYQILNYHNNTHPITKNISRHPINQSHPTHYPDHMTLHPTQPRLICKSKFPRFTIVQQNWSNTTLINLPYCFKDKPASRLTHHLTSWTFFTHYQFLHSASDAPPKQIIISPR